jgi:hypothetical protein
MSFALKMPYITDKSNNFNISEQPTEQSPKSQIYILNIIKDVYYAIQIAMKIQEYGIMRMKIKEINTLQ